MKTRTLLRLAIMIADAIGAVWGVCLTSVCTVVGPTTSVPWYVRARANNVTQPHAFLALKRVLNVRTNWVPHEADLNRSREAVTLNSSFMLKDVPKRRKWRADVVEEVRAKSSSSVTSGSAFFITHAVTFHPSNGLRPNPGSHENVTD